MKKHIAIVLVGFLLTSVLIAAPKEALPQRFQSMHQYLQNVYPYDPGMNPKSLFFFYFSVPKTSFPNPPLHWDIVSGGYKKNALFIPYYVKKGFFINKYPKADWWNYQYRKGFSNNQWIEVIHACCDAPKTGYWMYFAKGSGIEWNTGKTLVANNKIDALHKLGVDFNKMADLFPHFKFRSANGSWMTWQQIGKMKNIPTLSALFQQAAAGKDFAVARMSNTVELDETIASWAHQKDVDSVQMTLQPNGNGGWAFEVLDTTQLSYDPPNQQIFPPKGTVRLAGGKPCYCSNQSKAIALYCQGQESEKMYVPASNAQ